VEPRIAWREVVHRMCRVDRGLVPENKPNAKFCNECGTGFRAAPVVGAPKNLTLGPFQQLKRPPPENIEGER